MDTEEIVQLQWQLQDRALHGQSGKGEGEADVLSEIYEGGNKLWQKGGNPISPNSSFTKSWPMQ